MSEDTSTSYDFGISAELPWPKGNHTLAAGKADWRSAAYFTSSAAAGEHFRIEGFRQAAELIYTQMLASSVDRNHLVYPFVYTWRHTIELQLKELLRVLRQSKKISFDDDLVHTHNLAKLWSAVTPLTKDLIETAVVRKVEMQAATRIIGQLTAIDPDGQELRYHLRTDGSPSLANHNAIDPPRFQDAMQGCSAFLDGFIEHVYQELEYQREVAEEFDRDQQEAAEEIRQEMAEELRQLQQEIDEEFGP